jgi:signal transduction histidine kinase
VLGIESVLGKGTTVTVSLPAAAASDALKAAS